MHIFCAMALCREVFIVDLEQVQFALIYQIVYILC